MDSITSELHHRRLEIELETLDKTPAGITVTDNLSPFGHVISVIISQSTMQSIGQEFAEPLQFDLCLEGKFPFQAPKLLAVSSITHPSIADGRDLLPELIATPWNPNIPILEIIAALPEFVK
jgi:ubiquitin-protein ligase